jgi:hypothetical protein
VAADGVVVVPVLGPERGSRLLRTGERVETLVRPGFPAPTSAVSAAQENLERAIEVAAKALQVHGGYGYTQDFAVERLLRDAISPRAATGVTHAATGA